MIRRSDRIQRKLAEHKARLLILGCTEISKTWPACSWILRLFETVFKNLEEKSSQNITSSTSTTSCQSSSCIDAQMTDHQVPRASDKFHGSDNMAQFNDPGLTSIGLCEGEIPSIFQSDAHIHPFLNMPDFLDPELLSGFPHDFRVGNQEFYPSSMEFNFPDGG